MNVRELRTVGVRSYQLNGLGTGKRNTEVLYQSCSPYLYGDVLLIDDIADTGETFNFLLDHFKRNKNINKITTCSVFVDEVPIMYPIIMQRTLLVTNGLFFRKPNNSSYLICQQKNLLIFINNFFSLPIIFILTFYNFFGSLIKE